MHITDDVERPLLMLEVIPEWLAFDRHRVHLFGRRDLEYVAEAFALEVPQRTAELLALLPHDVRAEVSVGPLSVPLLAEFFRQIKHDGDRQAMIFAGEL